MSERQARRTEINLTNPKSDEPTAYMDTFIQITQLPTLQEFSHADQEPAVDRILAKAVALQLKPARAHITQFAFDRLLMLVDGQLNDMVAHLHRMSNLQRRESIAKGDLQMLLQGFNLTPSALEQQSRASSYYRDAYRKEFDYLHEVQPTLPQGLVPFEEQEVIRQNAATILVPPTNPLQRVLPSWLPNFPPDHTYKFTPQYSHPITDETVIRRKIVEEGKQSELALAHLSQKNPARSPLGDAYDEQLAQEETLAIYGTHKKRKTKVSSPADLLSRLPQTHFSVEEYAHRRVEIARKRVLEFEERQWQSQQDPFLKLSRIAFTPFSEKFTKRQAHKEFQSALKRSFLHLIKGMPELERIKREAEISAKKERDKKLEELRARRGKQAHTGAKDVLDLNELESNQDDFFAVESSEDEIEAGQPEPAASDKEPRLQTLALRVGEEPVHENSAEAEGEEEPDKKPDEKHGEEEPNKSGNERSTPNSHDQSGSQEEENRSAKIQEGLQLKPSTDPADEINTSIYPV